MIKKSCLLLVAIFAASFTSANAQTFTVIAPSDLGLSQGTTDIDGIFDISSSLGLADDSVSLFIADGNVSGTSDSWTVAENLDTTFVFSGLEVEAFVNHGSNLGSEAFQNGSLARDGIRATAGNTWTLVSNIDADYTADFSGNDYFVDYTGAETNQLEANSEGFRWESDGAADGVTVFSSNTVDLNNNYTIGFRVVSAVPEPATGLILGLGGLLFVRRRRA